MDWEDVIIHLVVAVVIQWFIMTYGGQFNAVLTLVHIAVWFGREVWQDIRKGHRWPRVWPLRWSTQKLAEFIAPVIGIAIVIALDAA